jgi:alkylation response protein AidB-like acyl-CoA dehydrogenase
VDFVIGQDDAALRDATRRFAQENLAPGAARADREAAFPDGHFDGLAEFGAMGLNLPAEHGGAGAPMAAMMTILTLLWESLVMMMRIIFMMIMSIVRISCE